MDQTLIDYDSSRKAGLDAVMAAMGRAGYDIPRQQFLDSHDAHAHNEESTYLASGKWRPTVERFRDLCIEYDMPHDGFAEALSDAYFKARFSNLHQYPETRAVLEALGPFYPLFLITNGPAKNQHLEIEVSGVAPYFRQLLVCDDYGMRKPDRRLFEMLREAAGVPDEAMLIVGDNAVADIDVPRAMGWATVWVIRDDARRAQADPARADAVVRSVAEVPGLLGL
jgi:putative hydrolase of the HAD superfamily